MYKAIIVDDEVKIREGLKNLVDWEEHGFIIVGQSSDGIEALEICMREKPSLVITDIKMPRMDGLVLAAKLKELDQHINIIIISGYNDFTYAKEAIKYGVSSYLLKPVDEDELRTEIIKVKRRIEEQLQNNKKYFDNSEKLKNFYLLKLIHGELFEKELKLLSSEYGVNIGIGKYCIILLRINDIKKFFINDNKQEFILIKNSIKNILSEIAYQTNACECFEIRNDCFGILFTAYMQTVCKGEFLRQAHKIQESILRYSNIEVTISIGDVVNSIIEVATSYKKAEALLGGMSYSTGKGNILYQDGTEQSSIVLEILKYIDGHYPQNIDLRMLADMFFINPAYLGRMFKKDTGEYFNDYLNKVRIDKAKHLLEENVLPINAIAEHVGYKFLDHFYRNFKHLEGINPGQYRKQKSMK